MRKKSLIFTQRSRDLRFNPVDSAIFSRASPDAHFSSNNSTVGIPTLTKASPYLGPIPSISVIFSSITASAEGFVATFFLTVTFCLGLAFVPASLPASFSVTLPDSSTSTKSSSLPLPVITRTLSLPSEIASAICDAYNLIARIASSLPGIM